MLNARTLFPPLFRPVDSGGGGEIREQIAEIDSQITRIDSQITDISGDITQIDSVITRLSNNVGDLTQLDTTDKSSLVGAVNEVAGSGGGNNYTTLTPVLLGKINNKNYYGVYFTSSAVFSNTTIADNLPLGNPVSITALHNISFSNDWEVFTYVKAVKDSGNNKTTIKTTTIPEAETGGNLVVMYTYYVD